MSLEKLHVYLHVYTKLTCTIRYFFTFTYREWCNRVVGNDMMTVTKKDVESLSPYTVHVDLINGCCSHKTEQLFRLLQLSIAGVMCRATKQSSNTQWTSFATHSSENVSRSLKQLLLALH